VNPLLNQFELCAERDAQRPAACDQSLMLDYASLRAAAGGLARRIDAETDRRHVGVMAPTSAASAAAIFACWYAGRVPVPLNFLLAADELGKILRDANVELVVTVARFAPLLEQAGVRTLILDGKTLAPDACETPPADASDLATIMYTSGTSGDPKGVRLTFDNLMRNCSASIEHMRLSPDQVMLSVLPQFHCFGFTVMTVLPLTMGATVWYLPRFSPVAVVETIRQRKVNIFMAIASMYGVLAKLKRVEREALHSLTLAISGGEPLPEQIAQAFEARFDVPIMEGYGLTETSPVVAANMPWSRKVGTVGVALPGIDVFAASENGTELGRGSEGELHVRGHCVMQGYHNQPELTAQVLSGGVLRTGDIGVVDADGFISITGRAKEMIIVGGENVFPREIENVLMRHPAVAEAAVIGRRDPTRGETPIAFVILREGLSVDEAELRSFCREQLAGYKVPREIIFKDDLPRGPTGKIHKRALKA